jgi:hypothetical protein
VRTKREVLAPIRRSELTRTLAAYLGPLLEVEGIALGRGTAPPEGGWPATANGSSGHGVFVPYVVLKAGSASAPAAGERDSLAAIGTSWNLAYQLTTHDVSESRVDDRADVARAVVVSFARDTGELMLDGVEWTVQSVWVPRLGATTTTRATDPPHWQVSDDVSLHLSRVSRV